MKANNFIVRVKIDDYTTFMSDEVTSFIREFDYKGREQLTLYTTKGKHSFYLDDIQSLLLYRKVPTN